VFYLVCVCVWVSVFVSIAGVKGAGAMETTITDLTFQLFFKNLSPYVASDENFIELVRKLTGLTNRKPAIQTKAVKNSFGEFVSLMHPASSWHESVTPVCGLICVGSDRKAIHR
jgi:hypothetical protein